MTQLNGTDQKTDLRLYINGEVRVTAFGAVDDDPAENLDGPPLIITVEHGIGAGLPYDTSASGEQFERSILQKFTFIDGQALDADDHSEKPMTPLTSGSL